jgi:hypothetical protein
MGFLGWRRGAAEAMRMVCGGRQGHRWNIKYLAPRWSEKRAGEKKRTYVEPRLRPDLLGEEHAGYAELVPPEVGSLEVVEALLEADVPPYGLHHAEAEAVEAVGQLQGGDLVLLRPARGLEPEDQALVALELWYHGLAAGWQGVVPLLAVVDQGHVGGV